MECDSWYIVKYGWWCVVVLATSPGEALDWAAVNAPTAARASRGSVEQYASAKPLWRLFDLIPKNFVVSDKDEEPRVPLDAVGWIENATLLKGVNAEQIGTAVRLSSKHETSAAVVWHRDREELFLVIRRQWLNGHDVEVWQRPKRLLLRSLQ